MPVHAVVSSTDQVNVEVKEMLRKEVREGYHGNLTDEQISRELLTFCTGLHVDPWHNQCRVLTLGLTCTCFSCYTTII